MFETCDCTTYYLISGALVAVLCLAAIVTFWCLKRSKAEGAKQNSCPAQEMIQVSDRTQEENVVYREIVFSNHKKPREKKPEYITYAEIRNTSQQDDELVYTKVKYDAKSKANNLPQNIDQETTYAEVKPMSAKSEPRDGSNEMYATMNKNCPRQQKK